MLTNLKKTVIIIALKSSGLMLMNHFKLSGFVAPLVQKVLSEAFFCYTCLKISN